MSFTKYNKIFGFICGLIAFLVYSLTVEPTASYWDCAEYISTSAKLQIGHPPGAPLFQMLGAIFSILAFDLEQIAFTVNMMSLDLLIAIMEHDQVDNVYFTPVAPAPGKGLDGLSMNYKVYVKYHKIKSTRRRRSPKKQ